MIADVRRGWERPGGGAPKIAQSTGRVGKSCRFRCQPAMCGVRPDLVVVMAPALDDEPSFGQAGEHLLVQALVAEPAVEALHEPVLLRLARRDVVPADTGPVAPIQDRARRHLRAVVAHDRHRLAALRNERIEFASQPTAADRRVHHQRQRLAGVIVDDAQDPQTSAPVQRVGDEIQAPALVRPARQRHRRPRPRGSLAAASPSDRQTFLAIKPKQLLLVHKDTLPLQQDAKPPIAKAATLGR